MALPTGTTVSNLTRCKAYPGFVPGGFCDQFLRKVRFEEVSGYGRQLVLNRAALTSAANYNAGAAMGLFFTGTLTASFDFQRIGDTVEVDSADVSASAEDQNQLELQVEMKRVSVMRQLANQIVQGDGVAPNLLGLAFGVDVAQIYDPLAGPGSAPVLDDYHRILRKACASEGTVGAGPDALVMHPRTKRQLIGRLESSSSCCADYVYDDDLGVPVLTIEGVPVYTSDQVSTTEDVLGLPGLGTLTSVYALSLRGPTAVRVLHQGGESSDYGIVTEEVPPQLATAVRAVTVRGQYSLLIPEVQSAARLKGVSIAGYPD